MKKILLTGGTGFFASRFALRYKNTYEIRSLSHRDLDVVNKDAVFAMVREFQPDIILHAAAIAVTEYCNQYPEKAHAINVDGTIHIAEAAAAYGAKVFFISSEQVFNGNSQPGPYQEADLPVPDTVYGQNKLEAEKRLQEILPECWIARFTWLFGMPDRNCGMSGNILWDTVRSILADHKLQVPVHEFRGMTYVHEMTEQVEKMFTLPYGLYHLGAENNHSRYEIVEHIFSQMGLQNRFSALVSKDEEKYSQQARDIRLCTSKAAELGIQFTPTMAAIEKCIKEYKIFK